MIAPDLDQALPETLRAVHFVGIGGSGMSGLARVFLEAGHPVSGSDRSDGPALQALRDLGATISIGHAAAHLPAAATALVFTGALQPDNPEFVAAAERGIPRLHRAQALAWLTRGRTVVAVAGSHGKTTSTGMIATALVHAGRDPSFVGGSPIRGLGTSARLGDPELWVIEADESDGSFLLYDTTVALVTNVDADHLDFWGSAEAYEDAFVRFGNAAGRVVISADDPGAQRVRRGLAVPVTEFGPDTLPALELQVPGMHNVRNAAGAYAVLVDGLGLAPAEALAGLGAFQGTERRFEPHGEVGGVRLYDDYAHHPTEVRAALAQARTQLAPGQRLIAVHQPHLFTRTRDMAGDFAAAYAAGADHLIVLDVFAAREDPIPGVSGALVAEAFPDPARVDFLPDWPAAAERVAALARPGDLVMTLSGGDVYRIIPLLRSALAGRGADVAGSAGEVRG